MPPSVKTEMIQSGVISTTSLPAGEEIELQQINPPSSQRSNKTPREHNDASASNTINTLILEQNNPLPEIGKSKKEKDDSHSETDSSEAKRNKKLKKKKKTLRKQIRKGITWTVGFLDGFGESVDGPVSLLFNV